jgi:ABC-type multidrug transport system fused ATPase/permease subunit
MSLSNGDNENTPWDRQIEIKNRYKKMNSTEHDISTTSAVGVRLEGIDLSFGKTHVLKGINLQIEPGEFFAFLGPSGCGKTTLLRLIAGFESAQAGRVIIGDREVSHLPPWRRNLGMVFQSYALWPHMTVYKNVAFGLEERHVPRNEIKERVEKTVCWISPAEDLPSFRVASSKEWPWPEPSSSNPRCFCWMSRFPIWMPNCAYRCAVSYGNCNANCP